MNIPSGTQVAERMLYIGRICATYALAGTKWSQAGVATNFVKRT